MWKVVAGTLRLCFSRTPSCKAVVFVATCDSVDFLYHLLTETFKAALGQEFLSSPIWKLHGDMEAVDRTGVALFSTPSCWTTPCHEC